MTYLARKREKIRQQKDDNLKGMDRVAHMASRLSFVT